MHTINGTTRRELCARLMSLDETLTIQQLMEKAKEQGYEIDNRTASEERLRYLRSIGKGPPKQTRARRSRLRNKPAEAVGIKEESKTIQSRISRNLFKRFWLACFDEDVTLEDKIRQLISNFVENKS
jgi:hypothetical protein